MNDQDVGFDVLASAVMPLQENRFLTLRFVHDDGPSASLVPNQLSAFEALSLDFRYEVHVLSDSARIELKDVEGKMVTVAMLREDGSLRYFNGYVFEFQLTGTDGGWAHYTMVLRPWLTYLQLRRDNYVFHGQSVLQQTQSIFDDYRLVADWRVELSGAQGPMTYASQFSESDYNYVHRRWEALGWHYRWEHRPDGHTLVLSDCSPQAMPVDGASCDVPWQSDAGSIEDDGIAKWAPVRRIMSASYSASSFDFKCPTPRAASVPTINQQGGDVLPQEVYEYVGSYGFKNAAEAQKYVELRMEEIESRAKHFEAQGNDRSLMPGRWFRLTGHFDHDGLAGNEDSEFLVVSVHHRATNNYRQGVSASYGNVATCLRRKIPWRPGKGFNSVEPKIYGPQTAIVVGPKGEEIYTDKYGRVKVQFHWDRVGEYDDRSSAWIRVASNWTGKGYGFIAIPRIGQEVVVSFLDGNPDRPLITGCVYNEDNLPAWGFPAAAHQTGIQSRSSPGGAGMCEMVIHDKAGHELINIFSQKDMVRTVLNNDSTVVQGPQQTIAVTTGTQATTVKKAIQVTSETEGIQHVAHTAYEVNAQTQHIVLQAATDIVLKVGASTLHMSQDGSILLEGVNITVKGSGRVDVNP